MRKQGWEFWIDRGGTFTDVIGAAPDGRLHVRKVLSAPLANGEDPGVRAARELLDSHADAAARVSGWKVGTTVATNALLERSGERVVLVATRGHADALRIGDQSRPDVFALDIQASIPLYEAVIEADERLDASGEVLRPLDERGLRAHLQRARERGIAAVAIAFLHADRHPRHEQLAAQVARECGFATVIASHDASPLIRYVPRGATTVAEAYLEQPLSAYTRDFRRAAAELDPQARVEFMQSAGGLVDAQRLKPSAALLSGPAGGVAGMARVGAQLGLDALIGFDMGGTSTDVAIHAGELARRYEHTLGGTRLQVAMLDIHTIAAGGGSLLRSEDGRLQVGPASAGSTPGPLCYGRGGPLTVTDAHVALGRLHEAFLPRLFGADGRSPIDVAAVARALPDPALAAAWLEIAVESMANAVRQVCAQRGEDPERFALFCFGGAAPQAACAVASACGMSRVVVHPLASVFSAYGIGIAGRLEVRRRSARSALDAPGLAQARAVLEEIASEAAAALAAFSPAEADAGEIVTRSLLEVRAGESESTLDIEWSGGNASVQALTEAFAAAHTRRYGYWDAACVLTIESVRAEARREPPVPALREVLAQPLPDLPRTTQAWFEGAWSSVPVVASAKLDRASGPALVVDPHFTLVVEPGWTASRGRDGVILLERIAAPAAAAPERLAADPARIEIFGNLFMHVATQMGSVLRDTAQSINIKERLDYSCALFDGEGRLLANAPHMPVHLGSMGASVRAVIARHAGRMRAGDAWLLNSPYAGGTHLPDLTVVSPLFLRGGPRPDAFVASRAHHADIGGVTPGSMPPFSRHIDEEGVVFEDLQLVSGGRFEERALREALASGRWPARNPGQNVADLRAQLAANARGREELERAAQRHGSATLFAYFDHVRTNAEACVRAAIGRLRSGRHELEMDGGQRIVVRIDVDAARGSARIDFTGTSLQGGHNFHAPRAVCTAAVLYVFRTLLDRPIPLNEGGLAPLEIIIPPRSMLAPEAPAAVVAGNVETSQCLVDALYGALGELAASQGTMNNFTFGNERVQYYETIAGGAGAGRHFDGASAVQTHMTNSRLTDPEILESRFPVRVVEFSIRRGSGGEGAHRGGDGVVRVIEFLEPMTGAMLANRRRTRPFGLEGGGDALPGITRLRRRDGSVEVLAASAAFEAGAGDRIEILTPGGGGYGAAS